MDKTLKEYRLSLVRDSSDSAAHSLPRAQVLPAQSPTCSTCQSLRFSIEPSHYFDDGWIVEWDPYSFPCVFERMDSLRYYRSLDYAMKRGTEVFQSKSQREPQVSPGHVNNEKDKDTEEPDQPPPSLLRNKGLNLETCDAEDFPDQDPASDSRRHLGCWAWLQRAFGQKKK